MSEKQHTADPNLEPHYGIFDVKTLLKAVLRWSWLLIIAGIIGAIIGINDVRNFTPKYEAKIIISPTIQNRGVSPSGLSSAMMGTAAQLGIVSKGTVSNETFERFKFMLRTQTFSKHMQEKYGLLQIIYKNNWDKEKEKWKTPVSDQSSIRSRLEKFMHYRQWTEPDNEDLAGYIGGKIKITKVKNTPYFKMFVLDKDPKFAFYLLNLVFDNANTLLGIEKHRERELRKEYLRHKLGSANLREVRSTLMSLLMSEEQESALTSGENNNFIKIIEPSRVSKHPSVPIIIEILGIPIFFSIGICFIIIICIISFRTE